MIIDKKNLKNPFLEQDSIMMMMMMSIRIVIVDKTDLKESISSTRLDNNDDGYDED